MVGWTPQYDVSDAMMMIQNNKMSPQQVQYVAEQNPDLHKYMEKGQTWHKELELSERCTLG